MIHNEESNQSGFHSKIANETSNQNSTTTNKPQDQASSKIRSLSQGPNRSRAELLARRKQLAAAGSGTPSQLGWSSNVTTNDETVIINPNGKTKGDDNCDAQSASFGADFDDLNGFNHRHHHNQSQHMNADQNQANLIEGQRSSRSQRRGSNNRGLSAEAKLESLSEQLKLHQAASANWPDHFEQDIATSLQRQQLHESHATSNTSPSSATAAANIESVYILLAKKDKDLQLAAELGKVLLEKNDELSKANEEQAEQYSRRLELLEEEKHKLRRRLEQLEVDYENRLIDVQTDCRLLQTKLDQQRDEVSRREREKSRLIDELGQQSQRLSEELAEATRSEELLTAQVEQLKERLSARGSHRQDQDVQVEALKSEIEIISQRKQDLERRLRLATDERVQLSGALDESGERLLLLESLLSERDTRLRDSDSELGELREASAWLSGQLDAMIALNERLAGHNPTNDPSQAGVSTRATNGEFSELELEALSRRSELIDQLRELRLRARTRTSATEMKLLGQRHRREANRAVGRQQQGKQLRHARPSSATDETGASSDGDQDDDDQADDNCSSGAPKLIGFEGHGTLASSIYKMLQRFQAQLERRRAELQCRQQQLSAKHEALQPLTKSTSDSSATSATSGTATGEQQQQEEVAGNAQIRSTTFSQSSTGGADDSGISAYDDENNSSSSEVGKIEIDESLDGTSDERLQDPKRWQTMLTEIRVLVEDLPCKTCHIMINERQKHDRLSRDFARISEELKRCEDQRLELSAQKTETEAKLSALEELCSTLKSDLDSGQQQPDEIVRLAWQRRDEAVSRKNACEIALAKSRIENLQLSSQLMEVVQQKSQLAEQVAQFEDDMHYMTQHSVKAKFSWEEQAERLRRDQRQANRQRQQQQSSTGGLSIGPLTSLLGNFTKPAPFSSASATSAPDADSSTDNSGNKAPSESLDKLAGASQTTTAGGSIMRNFTTNRLKLTRFWSNNKTPTSTTTTSPTTPTERS